MNVNTALFKSTTGTVIEYWTWGPENGYPVLFMHGATPMPFSAELAAEVEHLKLRVYTVLRPGYGNSFPVKYQSVYDCVLLWREWIHSLGIQHFSVMGLSAGSTYCYALVAAYSEMVQGVHICAGVPLANLQKIFRMNSLPERILFSLSKHISAEFLGKSTVRALEAMERKKGWQPAAWGEDMDAVFEKYVRPNWLGFGLSTRAQYRYWGFDATVTSAKVFIYHSKADEMIPYRIACASAELLRNGEVIPFENEPHNSEKTIFTAIMNIAREEM